MNLINLIQYSFISIMIFYCSNDIEAQKVKSIELSPIKHTISISTLKMIDDFILINSRTELNLLQFLKLEEEVNFDKNSLLFLTYTLPSHKSRYQVGLQKLKRSNRYIINLTITNVPKKNLGHISMINTYVVKKIENDDIIEVKVKYVDE